jgi:hypothetical protein
VKGCIHVGKVTEFDTDTCELVIDKGENPKTKKHETEKLKMGNDIKKLKWDKFLGCEVCLKEVDGVVQEII